MKLKLVYPQIVAIGIFTDDELHNILCGKSLRDVTKNLVRCKSSNMYAYTIQMTTPRNNIGNVIIQFKSSKGGPGDMYIYYDVPVNVYRKLISTSSKGHYFWKNMRSKYRYDKLLDRSWHGKLPNAVR